MAASCTHLRSDARKLGQIAVLADQHRGLLAYARRRIELQRTPIGGRIDDGRLRQRLAVAQQHAQRKVNASVIVACHMQMTRSSHNMPLPMEPWCVLCVCIYRTRWHPRRCRPHSLAAGRRFRAAARTWCRCRRQTSHAGRRLHHPTPTIISKHLFSWHAHKRSAYIYA